MSKRIQRDEEIYLTPSLLGRFENGQPVVIDERNSHKRLNPNDLDDKIEIYEREVEEWFLNPASSLLSQDSFGNSFIVLMVCMSYIEGVEQYRTGIESTRRSKECFVDSFKRLYPNEYRDDHLKRLYDKARCGLFHNGMVKGGVIFNNAFQRPIEFQDNGETIKVNPKKLLYDIKDDFERYINELKTPDSKSLRGNFDRMFTVL